MYCIPRDVLAGVYAIRSVKNYEELNKKALEMAKNEYNEKSKDEKISKVYEYIINRYTLDTDELIDMLSSAFMIKLAILNDAKVLLKYEKSNWNDFMSWFACKSSKEESDAYDYFFDLYERNVA